MNTSHVKNRKTPTPYDPDLVKTALGKAVFDIMEGVSFAQILINRKVWEIGGADLSHDWRAYSVAAVICYSRPFKNSYGLPKISDLIPIEDDFHKEIIRRRDSIIAHGDSKHFNIVDRHPSGSAMKLSINRVYLSEMEAKSLVELGLKIISDIEGIRNSYFV